MIRPCLSAKCSGATRQPRPTPMTIGPEVVDRERDDPDDDSRVPVEEARDDEERRADQGRGREPKDRAAAFGIVASHDPGENEVKRADEEVRDGEQQRVVSERPGNRERDEEHRPGRCEHDESHTAFVDIGRARQPGVGLPRPPDRGEDEHPAENARPRRLVCEQPRYLRDREHERQVEEQLERSDLVLGVDCVLALGLGHARTLASEQRPAGAASRQPRVASPRARARPDAPRAGPRDARAPAPARAQAHLADGDDRAPRRDAGAVAAGAVHRHLDTRDELQARRPSSASSSAARSSRRR